MARLTRVRQKVFASNASNNGVFGSLQAGNPQTSNDVATLQSLSAFENGWDDAIEQGDKLPPLEEFQGIQYGLSYQQAYMLQEGIAEWDANTPYYKGGLVKTISGTSFKLYCSLADNNTNKSVTNTSYWKKVMDSDDIYAYDSAVVHLAGNETITGSKTFSGVTKFTNSVNRQGSWTAGTKPSSNQTIGYNFTDSTGNVYGSINKSYATDGSFFTNLSATKTDGTGNIYISVGYDSNGNSRAIAPTPDTATSKTSTQIATTGWVNTVGNNVVHLTGDESVAGNKNFTGTLKAPTPTSATDNSTKVATTEWVRNHRCTTAATTTSSASADAPAYIVQNYKSGQRWYRVWSDGWIEQGGYVSGRSTQSTNKSITFLKAFVDTNYTVQLVEKNTEWADNKVTTGVQSLSKTGMTIRENAGDGCYYYVCGY